MELRRKLKGEEYLERAAEPPRTMEQ